MADMFPKLLTIIVPCFNMERYIEKCLDSLGVLGLKDVILHDGLTAADCLEVLVINDGSTDNTSKIAHIYAQSINTRVSVPVFHVIDKANGHYGSCINAGLAVASGIYVKILEADDTYDTKNFVHFLQYLYTLSLSKVEVVLSDDVNVDANDQIIGRSHHTLKQGIIYPIASLVQTRGCVFNGGLTYLIELLKRIGYRQIEGVCYTDTQWYLVPICFAKTLSCFPYVVYRRYLGRDDQSMNRVQYAKNTWMMEKVALHLLEQYNEFTKFADAKIASHVRNMIYECLLSIYTILIIHKERKYSRTELKALDIKLQNVAPDIFEKLGHASWSNFLSYHYVMAWRAGSPFLSLMAWICRYYSSLAMFVSRCRYRMFHHNGSGH